jgi:DNA-binding NtrC family response regulator
VATRTVLIVDEDRDRALELGRVLAAPDRQVGIVTNPAEALDHARRRTMDVVVTGLEFPSGANGLDVIRAYRAASQDVRVIVLSDPASMDRVAETLRALQDRAVRPPGATAPVRIDARVVAATGADVEAEIAAGRFRQDLFYRLAVFLIRVPPLRDCRQDIPRSASQRAGRAVTFSSGAIARLRQLDWPGNVRELENVVERLVASARTPVVEASDIGVDAVAGTPAGAHPFSDMPTLDELERRYLVYALQRFAGNRTRTAAALGIDRRTLYRMSARLGVPITGADLQGANTAGN